MASASAQRKKSGIKADMVVDPQRQIGARLKELRQQRGLTLAQLSKKTGISPSTMSNIENEKVSPTFANLLRLSEGLNISLSKLVAEAETPPTTARIAVTRRKDIKFVRTPTYDMGPLCTDLVDKRMTPLYDRIRATDAAVGDRLLSHSGEEFVYVLSGTLEIHTAHYKPIVLEVGDSAYLDSGMAHAYRARGEEPAEILMIWLSNGEPADAGTILRIVESNS